MAADDTAYRIQTVVDSVDPHTQADWWAQTLGWVVEPTDEGFIRSAIERGFATESDTRVHRGTLVWREGAAICPPEEVGDTDRTRILFQAVPEPRQGKNRVHWDVRTAGADIDALRAELEGRGADYQGTHSQGPHTWHVMTDPEGNEFCISPGE